MSRRLAAAVTTLGLFLLALTAIVAVSVIHQTGDAGDAAAIEELIRTGVDSDPPTEAGPRPPRPLSSTVTTPGDGVAGDWGDSRRRARTPYEPPDLLIEPGPAPIGLRIDGMDVDAPVVAHGVNRRSGEMEVPDNVTEVGWYRHGPSPGEPGSSVLAAHVDLAGRGPGVFFGLGKVDPGTLVVVEMDDGTERFFRVHARKTYDKGALPLDVIFAKEGPPILTLITCGGGFNRTIGSYDSNVVVYAVPVTGGDDPGDLPL